jgi:hypothetical protein
MSPVCLRRGLPRERLEIDTGCRFEAIGIRCGEVSTCCHSPGRAVRDMSRMGSEDGDDARQVSAEAVVFVI